MSVTTKGKDVPEYWILTDGTLILNGEEIEVILSVFRPGAGITVYRQSEIDLNEEGWERNTDAIIFYTSYHRNLNSVTIEIIDTGLKGTEKEYLIGKKFVLTRHDL